MGLIADPTKNPDLIAFKEAKTAVIQTIKLLNLEGLENRVYDQINEKGDKTNVSYPCVICYTEGLVPKVLSGDSVLTQYEFPVGVAILDDPGSKVHEKEMLYVVWLKRIIDSLHQQRLIGQHPITSRVEHGTMLNKKIPLYQGIKSNMTVWCLMWDDR
jgi:hypothetical protein